MSNLNDLANKVAPLVATSGFAQQVSVADPLAFLSSIVEYSDNPKSSQIRLLIISKNGLGKTWSALTAPNPIVCDFDRGMLAHQDRKIPTLNFYDVDFCKKINPQKPNARDAFEQWLCFPGTKTGAEHIPAGHTLIIDSWTGLQDFEGQQTDIAPKVTAKGKEDGYAKWATKLEYATKICLRLQTLACHVIVTAHEDEMKDENGALMNRVMPLMQGKFQQKMGNYFTHIVRMLVTSKNTLNSTGKIESVQSEWWWQCQTDDNFAAKCRGRNDKYKVPARWECLPQ